MTEDFETEEDYNRGEFGTQGSQSIGSRGDDLEPVDLGPADVTGEDDYQGADIVDVPSGGAGNGGSSTSSGSGDFFDSINPGVNRRDLIKGGGLLAALGLTGAGSYALAADSSGTESSESELGIDDLMARQYDQVDSIPGTYETDNGIIDLGQYADEMPDMGEGEVGQRILRTQNSELYDDMADESEWNDVFRQAGETGLMLEEDGSVFAYNETAQESRRFGSQDFNTGGEAYEGEDGESFEALYEELV